MLQEQIRDFSQRISHFAIDIKKNDQWQQVAEETTVGYKRICRIPTVSTDQIRLRILDARVSATISNFGLYFEPIRVTVPLISRDKQGNVSLFCNPPGPEIHFTLDGTRPNSNSPIYTEPIALAKGGRVKAVAIHPKNNQTSEIASVVYDICSAKWRVLEVSSEQEDNQETAAKAIDGDDTTNWITRWRPEAPSHPHSIAIDLGEDLLLKGFTYTPRSDARSNGTILDYQFFVSTDGISWGEPKAQGKFDNIVNNPVKQFVRFSLPQKARYIKLVALSEIRGNPWASAAEIGIITK
jgi:alpha-L-fucosidase